MCLQWRELLGLPVLDGAVYAFDALVEAGALKLAGPFKCRGMTADVVFLIALQRRARDTRGHQGATKGLRGLQGATFGDLVFMILGGENGHGIMNYSLLAQGSGQLW